MSSDARAVAEATESAGLPSALRLASYSFLVLFSELALIRFLPATVKVFSYYTNFVLIAAFVGMGAGLLAVRHWQALSWILLPVALALFGIARWFSNVLVRAPQGSDEYFWALFDSSPAVREIGIVPTVAILFVACSVFFVPLGAMMGAEFRRFRPLVAYSIDIGGSLSGIIAFGVVSYLGWPPWWWFCLGFALLLAASLHRPLYAGAVLVTAPLAIILVASVSRPNESWSPYYRIEWRAVSGAAYMIDVNSSRHLTALDLSERGVRADPWVRDARAAYRAPFRYAPKLDNVLVLGAGAGNDVALLLERGAKRIDAVEIDPEIAALGSDLHFQQPYRDPRVQVHITDARAFLRTTERRYDLIVFGTLDSQTLLSGMSSVRLDNYVYTLESVLSAKDALAPGGRLIMYHMSTLPYIAAKIFQLLTAAFGEPPIVIHFDPHLLFNFAFVSGLPEDVDRGFYQPGVSTQAASGEELADLSLAARHPYPRFLLEEVALPTDDWPYLYLRDRSFPTHYLQALAVVIVFSALLVVGAGGKSMRGGADGEMFLLGLGFLLLETKSVTEMSLLFGSTWKVNLLVFSSILGMILLANWLVMRRPQLSLRKVLVALLLSLALGVLVPVRALASSSLWLEWTLGGALVATPIFFAALVFAVLFRRRSNPTRSLGYNVFGAAVGGVLEYSVMLLGVKKLYLVAAVAYALVWASRERMPQGAPRRAAFQPGLDAGQPG